MPTETTDKFKDSIAAMELEELATEHRGQLPDDAVDVLETVAEYLRSR